MPATDVDRENCWRQAIECFGTGHIFEARVRSYRARMRFLAFSGIVLPLTVGAVAGAFGADSDALRYAIGVAGVLGVGQLVLSAWAISAKWDDAFGYSQESMSDNMRLATEFEKLAKQPPPDFSLRLAIAETESKSRENQDLRQVITEEEKRMGMRYALRRVRRACAACGIVPVDMAPTDCPVCGKF